jgi:UV DNA damage repair endonuclease
MSNKVTAQPMRIDSAIHMTAEALRKIGTPLSEQQIRHILHQLAYVVAPVIRNKDKEIVNEAVSELAATLDTYAQVVSWR